MDYDGINGVKILYNEGRKGKGDLKKKDGSNKVMDVISGGGSRSGRIYIKYKRRERVNWKEIINKGRNCSSMNDINVKNKDEGDEGKKEKSEKNYNVRYMGDWDVINVRFIKKDKYRDRKDILVVCDKYLGGRSMGNNNGINNGINDDKDERNRKRSGGKVDICNSWNGDIIRYNRKRKKLLMDRR